VRSSDTSPAPTPSDRQIPDDALSQIVVRIVEVIPLWAKLVMFGLGALVIGLAVGAHRRLRQRAVDYHHQALHDALTELPNRAHFGEVVDDALVAARDEGGMLAVLLIDLDGFKEVNDTLGHSSGDRLLEEVAHRLAGAVRAEDTVARLGGDEFAVLLPRVQSPEAAAATAVMLRQRLQGLYDVDEITVHTDSSVGVAIGPHHGTDAETLLRRADVAMYTAKERRVGAAVYDPRLDRYSPERLAIAAEMRLAIAAGQFVLYYQPQVEPRTGRVDSVEALVRWRHPQRGIIGPDDFVPLAERTGLIRPLTAWVLEAAIRECAAWRAAGVELDVAVNLSAANLVDTDLPNLIDRLLRAHSVPARSLRLEITESTAMADPARTRAILSRLNGLGTPLAIDDFGTGYSSLAYLRSLPVRELKIDRSFVRRMTTDPNDRAIVVATIDLGHTLGLRVVAEGVEDRATVRALNARGCDLIQGYLVAPPLPVADLRRWLAAWPGSPWTGGPPPAVPRVPVAAD
jgi:diguanylate cyclase (GGDEF)-like protein